MREKLLGVFKKILVISRRKLYETIVDFHNTEKRYQAFKKQWIKILWIGLKRYDAEIDFAKRRKDDVSVPYRSYKAR